MGRKRYYEDEIVDNAYQPVDESKKCDGSAYEKILERLDRIDEKIKEIIDLIKKRD
jgi:hypothetical protein